METFDGGLTLALLDAEADSATEESAEEAVTVGLVVDASSGTCNVLVSPRPEQDGT